MATDARGHEVPAAADHPTRQSLLSAMLSVRDPIPVANTTARATLITTLAALSPAIVPSTSNPVFVFRADAGAGNELEYTVNGTTWVTVRTTVTTQSGSASGTTSGGGDIAVTFTTAFPSAPKVVVQDTNTGGGIGMIFWKVHTKTTTGFTARAFPATGSSPSTALTSTFDWIATL